MYKLYLVRFTLDGQKVYKPGITSHIDVAKRFKRILDEGIITDFKIMKSSYFENEEEAMLKLGDDEPYDTQTEDTETDIEEIKD